MRSESGISEAGKKHHRLYCRRTGEIGIQQGIDTAILSACSLNPFFNSSVTADAMEQKLTDFCNFASERLGSISFSYAGDRFCFYLAPEAAEYVHENKEKDVFIFELVKLLQERNTTLDSVITLFQKWDNSCVVEEVDTDEFNILIRFVNRDDPYYYCFKDEGCHVIYHRYLPEDYVDFGF